MLGWLLLRHAVLMLLRSFTKFLHILSVPIVVGGVGFGAIHFGFSQSLVAGQPSPAMILAGIAVALACYLCLLGAAVNWHRFVLLNEPTHWFMSPFRAGRTFAYFVQGFVVGLLIAVPSFTLSFITIKLIITPLLQTIDLAALTGLSAQDQQRALQRMSLQASLAFLPAQVLIYWLFLKLSVALPAAAVENAVAFNDAFSKVRIGLVAVCVLGLPVLAGPTLIYNLALTTFGFGAAVDIIQAITWLVFVCLNLSLLTTIYGHFIEGRELT